jgi:hypothetical protein
MNLDDENEPEAVGAEKSPRSVGRFVLLLLLASLIALGLVLLYLHFHTPVIQDH